MSDLPAQYLFQPRLNQLIVYYDFARPDHYSSFKKKDLTKNFKGQAAYSGDISKSGQKKLRRAIETLFVITPTRRIYNRVISKMTNFKLSHLTLTLSSVQGKWTDKEINTFLLRPFLLDCKRKFNLVNYVWKAERQANGNLHYHVISDLFFDLNLVRKFWNDKQETLGFIDQFEQKFKHRNPPSIEITYVRNSDQLAKYVSKYISKSKTVTRKVQQSLDFQGCQVEITSDMSEDLIQELQNRNDGRINGRVWDCSEKLKSFKYQATSLSCKDESAVNDLISSLNCKRFDSDYFSVITFSDDTWLKNMPVQLRTTFIDQYQSILDSDREIFMRKRNNLNIN